MSYCSYLHWIHSILFLPKDKCDLCFLSWKLGDRVEKEETSLQILALMLCGVQSNDLLDSPLPKSLFRPATREKINCKRSGESRNRSSDVVICDQERRENQVSLRPTRSIDCLIAIQWGTLEDWSYSSRANLVHVHTIGSEQLKRELNQLFQEGSNCCPGEDRKFNREHLC